MSMIFSPLEFGKRKMSFLSTSFQHYILGVLAGSIRQEKESVCNRKKEVSYLYSQMTWLSKTQQIYQNHPGKKINDKAKSQDSRVSEQVNHSMEWLEFKLLKTQSAQKSHLLVLMLQQCYNLNIPSLYILHLWFFSWGWGGGQVSQQSDKVVLHPLRSNNLTETPFPHLYSPTFFLISLRIQRRGVLIMTL